MNKLNISLIITIATILLSVGGTWAIVQNKVAKIDKLEDTVTVNDKKIAVIETQLAAIDENLKEQKESVKEMKSDLKDILKAVLK